MAWWISGCSWHFWCLWSCGSGGICCLTGWMSAWDGGFGGTRQSTEGDGLNVGIHVGIPSPCGEAGQSQTPTHATGQSDGNTVGIHSKQGQKSPRPGFSPSKCISSECLYYRRINFFQKCVTLDFPIGWAALTCAAFLLWAEQIWGSNWNVVCLVLVSRGKKKNKKQLVIINQINQISVMIFGLGCGTNLFTFFFFFLSIKRSGTA